MDDRDKLPCPGTTSSHATRRAAPAFDQNRIEAIDHQRYLLARVTLSAGMKRSASGCGELMRTPSASASATVVLTIVGGFICGDRSRRRESHSRPKADIHSVDGVEFRHGHRTRTASRKRGVWHYSDHCRVPPTELATRLPVDRRLEEQRVAPLTGLAGRAERALKNYLETFPFFAASILIAAITNTHDWLTLWGTHFYFWGRIGYAMLYWANLPSCSFAGLERPNARHLNDRCRADGKMTCVSRDSIFRDKLCGARISC